MRRADAGLLAADESNNAAASSSLHHVAAAESVAASSAPGQTFSTSSLPSVSSDAATSSPAVVPSRWRLLLQMADPRSWQPLMGWPLLITYLLLTFAQELPVTTIGLMLANDLHFGSDSVYEFYAATFVPWSLRPLYAFVSDQVPLGGWRRKPYFLLCALCAGASQVCLALWGTNQRSFLALAVATQFFLAFCEVVCDSLSVEWGNELALRVCAAQLQAATTKAKEQADAARRVVSPRSISVMSGGEWATPLLPEHSIGAGGTSFFPRRLSDSVSSSPPALSRSLSASLLSASSALSSDQERGSYNALASSPSFAERALRSLQATETPAPSPAASSASPSPSGDGVPSAAASALTPADTAAAAIVAHLLASTPDPSVLTPLHLKSRIQSECMSIRSAGSVCAAAMSTWVFLAFLSPRSVLLWSSTAFILGAVSMLYHRLERKVGRGYFGLATAGASTPHSVGTRVSAPAAAAATSHAHPPRDEVVEHDVVAATPNSLNSPSSLELDALPSVHAPLRVVSSHGYSAVRVSDSDDDPSSSSAAPSSDASIDDPHVCGMERSRWVFLSRKLFALLRALRLLLGPLTFIFLVNLVPSSENAYFNYLYSQYGNEFSNSEFSSFNFMGLLGALFGCLVYQRAIAPRAWSMRRVFLATTVASSGAGMVQVVLALGKNRSWFGMGDESWLILSSFLVSGVQMLAQLPPIILASYYAPKDLGLEASCFSLFAAAAHVASLAEAELTAAIVRRLDLAGNDYSNLWKLIVVCNVAALVPLISMPLLLHPRVTGRRDEDAFAAMKPPAAATEANTSENSNAASANAVPLAAVAVR